MSVRGQGAFRVFELTVQLEQAASIRGRLMDHDGAPVQEARLKGPGILSKDPIMTDKDGRFEIRGLMPSRKYAVEAFVTRRCFFGSMPKPTAIHIRTRTWRGS